MCKLSMTNLFDIWLREAGIEILAEINGTIEASPLYTLNAEELKEKFDEKAVFG